MTAQIFETKDIPSCLWDPIHEHGKSAVPKGRLKLPAQLELAYRQVIDDLGLKELAENIKDREEGAVGGEGNDGANAHFAKRFSGSCGRIQLYALDPHQTFKTTRQSFAHLFSGGKLRILDIPLGAGAGAVTLISLVAHLRSLKQPVFPKIDLDVEVIGGDKNNQQIELSVRMHSLLKSWWIEQGVNVTWNAYEWDVLSDESTSDLIDKWRDGINGSIVPIVVGANFSGFLGSCVEEGKPRRWLDEAESCLRQIFAVAAKHKAVTFWVEPAEKRATVHFLPNLRKQVFKRFTKIVPTLENEPQSTAYITDPLVREGGFVTRASGIHLTASE